MGHQADPAGLFRRRCRGWRRARYGQLSSLFEASPAAAADEPWIEASIPQLQALMASRQLTSRELTLG